MIIDAARYVPAKRATGRRALGALVEFLESRLDVSVIRDRRLIPFGREDLIEPFELAEALISRKTLSTIIPWETPPDVPPFKMWRGQCGNAEKSRTSGASWRSDSDALTAALAEALERTIWWSADDYFNDPLECSTNEIRRRSAPYIDPDRFASFSPQQRAARKALTYTADTPFLWIKGMSLTSDKPTYVPAQTITGLTPPGSTYQNPWGEPLIRNRHTVGLATWPTQTGAQLAGALECIEREAYMIMWLNQLSTPRLRIESLRQAYPDLTHCLDACEQYRFTVHLLSLPTDAPTHALCAVLEDKSGRAPRFSLGLKAHRSLAAAVEKSILEALRAHGLARLLHKDTDVPPKN